MSRRTLRAVTPVESPDEFLSKPPSFHVLNRSFYRDCVALVSDQRYSLLFCTDAVNRGYLKRMAVEGDSCSALVFDVRAVHALLPPYPNPPAPRIRP
jgi:hypothetical protein